jgi:deazaflavin-dependent oxidoreductase (nitroreductase family)
MTVRKPNPLETAFNRVFGWLVGLGLAPADFYLLQVRGRKTGRVYSTPVDVLRSGGRTFLVAPRGETQWARNARASGAVTLKRGRAVTAFAAREVGDQDKPDVLRAYLDRFKGQVQRFFPVAAGSPREAFVPLASRYPVFELIPK